MCFFEGILLCSLSGNHPYEDLAKFGYKPDMKYKSLNNLLLKAKFRNPTIFIICFPHICQLKPSKPHHFPFYFFKFSF